VFGYGVGDWSSPHIRIVLRDRCARLESSQQEGGGDDQWKVQLASVCAPAQSSTGQSRKWQKLRRSIVTEAVDLREDSRLRPNLVAAIRCDPGYSGSSGTPDYLDYLLCPTESATETALNRYVGNPGSGDCKTRPGVTTWGRHGQPQQEAWQACLLRTWRCLADCLG
jgi:hypothetical protein